MDNHVIGMLLAKGKPSKEDVKDGVADYCDAHPEIINGLVGKYNDAVKLTIDGEVLHLTRMENVPNT